MGDGTGRGGTSEADAGEANMGQAGMGDGGTPGVGLRPSRIQEENTLPGTTTYELVEPANDHELEAYTSAVSAMAGDTLEVRVNVSVDSEVSWALFRLGYYQGLGAREVAHGEQVHVEPQPDCPVDSQTGLVECQWATAFGVTIGVDWVTGYYLFKLTRADGFETTVPFIVREAKPVALALVQASTNTWQAYNRWGGTSLYHDARKVSYDRPYDTTDPPGQIFAHEMYLMTWLEQRGIDVAYTTNVDVDREPSELDTRKLFVASGHDEYWSLGERQTLDRARDDGISLAILSANTGYWRVRLEASSSGVDRRIVTCYKSATDDPVQDQPDTTARFRDSPDAQPENELTGVLYQVGDYPNGTLPLYVADANHWLFAGTGVKTGERLAVALGGEWDEPAHDSREPSGVDVVLSSPAIDQTGHVTSAAAAVYEPTDHSFVFSAGTEEFAHALSEPHASSPRAERMLDNILARAGVEDPSPTPDLAPTPSTLLPGQVVVLAGTGKAGYHDGAANEAQFDSPAGLAVGPDGTLYVTESRNHDVRAIAADGSVTTLAGRGPHGSRTGKFKDAVGDNAEFDAPNGIAVNAAGVVFVADSGNNRIRSIAQDGTVSTYAGGSAGSRDGTGSDAEFTAPEGLAIGADGSLFVVEPKTNSLRRIDLTAAVTTLTTDAVGATALAVGPDGTVYVASPHTGSILAWTGTDLVALADANGGAGERVSGSDVHSPLDAWLRPSAGLALDGARLVFSDMGNDAVRELVLGTGRQGTALDTLIPETAPDDELENGQPAGLMLPRGLVPYGDAYAVADTGHHRVVLVKSAAALGAR
jgi:sugar lactone lactonase YvrE